jgi:hypothetical protein
MIFPSCAAQTAERVALLSTNPDKAAQLGELGVTVTECLPTGVYLSKANASYLAAKASHAAYALDVPAGQPLFATHSHAEPGTVEDLGDEPAQPALETGDPLGNGPAGVRVQVRGGLLHPDVV